MPRKTTRKPVALSEKINIDGDLLTEDGEVVAKEEVKPTKGRGKVTYSIDDVMKELKVKYPRSQLTYLTGRTDTEISRLATHDEMLNLLLSGGVPEGRIIEIFGAPGSGKTSLSLRFAEAYTKAEREVLYIDTEYALNPVYAKRIGVDLSKIVLSQPESAEEVFDIIFTVLKTMRNGLIIVDSTAAMLPIVELRAEGGGQHGMVNLPRIMARNLTKLVGLTARANTTVIFISQTRTKISTMPTYGPARKGATGGNALKFYASLRLRTTKVKTLKSKTGEQLGQITSCKAVKSKTSRAFAKVEWYLNAKDPSDFITSLAINVPNKSVSLDKKRKMVQNPAFRKQLLEEIGERLSNFEEECTTEEIDWASAEFEDEKLDKEELDDLKDSVISGLSAKGIDPSGEEEEDDGLDDVVEVLEDSSEDEEREEEELDNMLDELPGEAFGDYGSAHSEDSDSDSDDNDEEVVEDEDD